MDVEASGRRLDLNLNKRPRHEAVVFGKLMAVLAGMKSRDVLNEYQIDLYEDATAHIELKVIAHAVGKLTQTPGAWRPDTGDLVGLCEESRLEIRKALVYQPCPICAETSTPGWMTVNVNGAQRLARCECWKGHQQRVQELGVGEQPLSLPAARESDLEKV